MLSTSRCKRGGDERKDDEGGGGGNGGEEGMVVWGCTCMWRVATILLLSQWYVSHVEKIIKSFVQQLISYLPGGLTGNGSAGDAGVNPMRGGGGVERKDGGEKREGGGGERSKKAGGGTCERWDDCFVGFVEHVKLWKQTNEITCWFQYSFIVWDALFSSYSSPSNSRDDSITCWQARKEEGEAVVSVSSITNDRLIVLQENFLIKGIFRNGNLLCNLWRSKSLLLQIRHSRASGGRMGDSRGRPAAACRCLTCCKCCIYDWCSKRRKGTGGYLMATIDYEDEECGRCEKEREWRGWGE